MAALLVGTISNSQRGIGSTKRFCGFQVLFALWSSYRNWQRH